MEEQIAIPCKCTKETMKTSIIINTYNRAPFLLRLLAGLGHLENSEFEVIVVNGPSTDQTQSVLEQYQDRVKVVQCPSRNLSQSRNLGIAAAAGELAVFIDDDALPADSQWLQRYVWAFEIDEMLGAAGGPVLHRDTEAKEFDGGYTSEYGFQKFGSATDTLSTKAIGAWFPGVPGGNVAYRRSALVHVGGFDEFFVYYLDESDVCIRLSRSGYRVAYLPENAIRHYKAASRTALQNINWDVITRSDTYFAWKNAEDRPVTRLAKTVYGAFYKHFFIELMKGLRSNLLPTSEKMTLLKKWSLGLLGGLWSGMTQPRHLGKFAVAPSPFLPFPQPPVQPTLRIALLTQTVPGQASYGGIGRYTYDLARGLHERGHKVHILCRDENPLHHESLGFVVHGLPSAKTSPQPIARSRPILNKNLTYALAVERKLADLYAQGVEFDVVHASNWDAEAVALIRERVYPTALMLVTPLAQVIQTEKWSLSDDLEACVALDRWQIEHADVICVPSRGVLKSYQSLMGMALEQFRNLQVTSLGIIPESISSNGSILQKKSSYRLLFVGRLEWRKGAQTLLDALPSLMPRFLDWECHFVGDDTAPAVEGKTFKELFTEQHTQAPWLNRVIFHGLVSEAELRRQYQMCDLFVAPSLFESFGLIFQEAMQYGKAVVGCRTGGIPEVVAHGVEGLLVTPDSPLELRDALAQLMQDQALRESMGKAGKHRIRERDNYQTMALHLEKVYMSLIAAKGDEYQARRKGLWPRALPLLESGHGVRWSGPWELHKTAANQFFCKGAPGASLEFEAQTGSRLEVAARRHPNSGLVKVCVNGRTHRYLDLYSPREDLEYRKEIQFPNQEQGPLEVKLQVHSERNPQSYGTEIWLREVQAVMG
jgi:glycogen synthase